MTGYSEIKEDLQRDLLWTEERAIILWTFLSIPFNDFMCSSTNWIRSIQNFMIDNNFSETLNYHQAWIIGYVAIFVLILFVVWIFQELVELFFKIKPNWY